jgi:hypothetical protein
MRILVCGGRNYSNRTLVFETLDRLAKEFDNIELCHGGARGADSLANEWALTRNSSCTVFKADWDTYGRAAGSLRNQKMLDEFKPAYIIAFPGGRGTQDMINRAERSKINCLIILIKEE